MIRALALLAAAACFALAAPAADAATLTVSSETYVLDSNRASSDPTGLRLYGANNVVVFEFGGERYAAVSTTTPFTGSFYSDLQGFTHSQEYAGEGGHLAGNNYRINIRPNERVNPAGENTLSVLRIGDSGSVSLSTVTEASQGKRDPDGGQFAGTIIYAYDAFSTGGKTFLPVTGHAGNTFTRTIQLVEIVERGGSVDFRFGPRIDDGQVPLAPWTVQPFEAGGNAFLAVGSFLNHGLLVLAVSTEGDLSLADRMASGVQDLNGNTYGRAGAGTDNKYTVEPFTMGGTTYLLVCDNPSYQSSACDIFSVRSDGKLTLMSSWQSDRMKPTGAATTFTLDGRTYAAVGGSSEHYEFTPPTPGVYILDVTDPANPRHIHTISSPTTAATLTDTDELGAGFTEIGLVNELKTVTVGQNTYLLASNSIDRFSTDNNGFQAIDVTDPANPLVAATLDSSGGALLTDPSVSPEGSVTGMDTFRNDLGLFSIVSSYYRASGLQVLKVVDDAPPRLFEAGLSADNRQLVLKFDEPPVGSGTVTLSAAAPGSGGPVQLAAPAAVAASARTITVPLSAEQARTVGQFAGGVEMSAPAGLWQDRSGNAMPRIDRALTSAVALTSAAVDMNNFTADADPGSPTNRAAASVTLGFGGNVEAHTSGADTLSKITIRDTDGSPSLKPEGASIAISSNMATVGLTPAQKLAVQDMSNVEILVGADAFRVAGGQLALTAQRISAPAPTPDATGPVAVSAALDEGAGVLTVRFDEAVKDGSADPTKIFVNDGQFAAGGTPLSASSVTGASDADAGLSVALGSAELAAVLGYSDPHVRIDAGAVDDLSDLPASASQSAPLFSNIELRSAAVDLNNFTADADPGSASNRAAAKLTLVFSGNVVVHTTETDTLSKITIRDTDGSPSLALDGASIAISSSIATVGLTPEQKTAVQGMSDMEILVGADAFKPAGGQLALTASRAPVPAPTPDATGPVAVSVALDEATGILAIEFDERVKDSADLAKIFLADGSFATGGTALTGSQITSSGDLDAQITIQLTEALRQAGALYAVPHLRFGQGAVEDLSDLPAAASAASLEVSDTPDPSVLPAVMSAESVSPHTVRIYFNMSMTGAGSAEAWSAGGSSAVSVRVPQERVITQDIPPPPRPDLPTILWPVPASWTTQYLDSDAVLSAYITFRDPVMSGQSLSYAPGNVADFHERAMAAQSIQISARSAYAPVDTAAVLASAVTDGQASGSPVSPGSPYRTVKNFDPGYVFNIPSITHYHSLGGAADVDVYSVDGEELARTLYSDTWTTVRYDPSTEQAHLSGRIGSPDTPSETVSLRGSAGTFAVVASAGDNGLQIVDITDPYSPRSVAYMADGRSPMYGCADPNVYTGQQLHCITPTTDLSADPLRRLAELDGTDAVEIVKIGDRTFAVAASPGAQYEVGGFQMVDITDPGDPNSGYSVNNGAWATNIDALLTISDLAVFETGGKTYVAFASQYGGTDSQYQGAVTILDISNPAAIQQVSFAVAGERDADGRLFDSLYNPTGIDTFVSGGSVYAVVSSLDDYYYGNDGDGSVQILDLSDPASPKRSASITPGLLDRDGRAFGDIYSPGQVQTFSLGGVPHAAIVASEDYGEYSGEFIQIVNLADPSAPRSAGVVGPYQDGHPLAGLDSIKRIDIAEAGGRTVLAATIDSPDGLFLIDISDPASPQRLAFALDGHNDPAGARVGLDSPLGVSLRSIDGRLYAAVASSDAAATGPANTDGGLTILDLTDPAGLGSSRTVTVGALVPLTGPVSSLGEHWEAAMQVGVKDLNERLERTDADWRVRLDIRDSRAEPDTALARLSDLNSAGIKAVIGPATSGGVTRVQDYAAANGMTILSYGSTAASLAQQDGIFRLIPPDTLMGPFIAEQLLNAGIKHATIAYRDDAWGRGLAESVRDGFQLNAGYTTALVPFVSSTAEAPLDSAALVSQMSATHVASNSAVLLFDFSTDTVEIMAAADAASSAPGASPGAAALGTSQWFGTSILDTILSHTDQVRDFASQVRYTSVDAVFDRSHPQFDRVTREISARLPDGHRDFGIYTYAAYDSVHLMGRAVLLGDSAAASALMENIPAAARGHAGLIGDTTLDINGDLAGTEFQLLQVRGGQAVSIPKYEVPLTVTEFTVTSRHSSGMATGGTSYEPTGGLVLQGGQHVLTSGAGSCLGDGAGRTIVDISFQAAETFTMGEFDILINGRSAALQPPLPNTDNSVEEITQPAKRFEAEWAACGTDADGPLDISIEVMIDGVPVSFGEEKLTGPNVIVDNTAPQLEQISLVGQRSMALFYSEPVVTAASDYTLFEYGASSVPAASSVHGSGTASVLAMLAQSNAELMSSTRIDFQVSGVTDRVGNALLNGGAKSLVPADVRDGTVALRDTARDGRTELILPPDSIVRTVVASSPMAIDASLMPDPVSPSDSVASAGGQTAEFASGLTVMFDSATVVLPAGLQMGGLPADQTLPMSASSSTVPSGDYVFSSRLDTSRSATLIEVGDPAGRVELSLPARIEFSSPLQELVFVVTGGQTLAVQECPEELTASSTHAEAAGFLESLEAQDGTDAGSCYVRESSTVWTGHFSAWGTGPVLPPRGSECDDCTPPTLGYDEYGAKLVDGGFAYNGLASDVSYFFTPYPLIESEVGKENTAVFKIYENQGPGNIEHISMAFGLRSGEVISESRAVINYDISFDGTGTISVIDPDGAIDLETLSASHDVAECSAGSSLECLSVTITHMFRAPLEFDIVGTDVWDRERNSWQNYYNHGIRVSGEPMDPQPGIEVDGMVLYQISSNTDILMDAGGHLFKLSPEGAYLPLYNQSRLYHDIDESMYVYDGMPKQGYDRGDPEFRDHLYAQVMAAQKILDSMMPAPEADAPAPERQLPDLAADEQRLREAVLAEQARAALLFEELFGYQRINAQD